VQTKFNIVLLTPQIPNNTGNIGRLCVATNAILHLIEPLGFELSDKYLKRAGLDYWQHLEYYTYPSLEGFYAKHPDSNITYFSAKAENSFWDHTFHKNHFLFFGREADGLPVELRENLPKDCLVKIPFTGKVRSFNLANAVSIALFEAIRQNSYEL